MRGLPVVFTGALAASVVAFGVGYGTFVAADTDPYGYVSEAELIARGELRVDQRFALTMPWREAEASFIPTGYTQASTPGFMAPVYPPGLPLTMALALRATEARESVFYVVPLLGAVAVVATALMGKRLFGWQVGASAALLLSTSPSFLLQVTQPVSDVPAAAWWAVATLFALSDGKWAAAAAGGAAALAILTRPNLVPLAGVLFAFYVWRWTCAPGGERRAELRAAAAFSSLVGLGCVMVAAFNTHLYGSLLRSGYAPFHELYQWHHIPLNLDRYPRWLLMTQSPFIYLALLAPWVLRNRCGVPLLLLVIGTVVLSYLPYGYFDREQWGYVRFLLPAYPTMLVLSVAVARELLNRLVSGRGTAIAVGVVVMLAAWQVHQSVVVRGVHLTHQIEQRYKVIGRYIESATPRDAIFVAGLHSGSIRYYSGRLTLNYPRIQFRSLDHAIAALTARGRKVFVVLELGEEDDFRWHFATDNEFGKLDWPPLIHSAALDMRIYDAADRQHFLNGQPVLTYNLERLADKPVVTQR